jgi:hypothetical protein
LSPELEHWQVDGSDEEGEEEGEELEVRMRMAISGAGKK